MMASSLPIYSKELLAKFNEINCNPEQLHLLRFQFKDKINSIRTLSRLNSIQSIIQVLIKRDIINETDMDALIQIAVIANRMDMLDSLSTHSKIETQKPTNPQPAQHQQQSGSNINENEMLVEGKRKAYLKISEHMGKNWRDFARAMGIIESKIDELDKYRNVSESVMYILNKHEENCMPIFWRSKLLRGLEDAKRKDLRKDVETIFDIHSILKPNCS